MSSMSPHQTQNTEFDRDWQELVSHLPDLAREGAAPEQASTLETVCEILYADAENHSESALYALSQILGQYRDTPGASISEGWRALVAARLTSCAGSGDGDSAWRELDAALQQTPPRSRWLIQVESARIVYRRRGPRAAWKRFLAAPQAPARDGELDHGPLVIHAVLTGLHLAAAVGQWQDHAELLAQALKRWPEDNDPKAARVDLLAADHAIRRGRYTAALQILSRRESAIRGDLRLDFLCIRLHALVACSSSFQHERASRTSQRESELVGVIDQVILGFEAELVARETNSAQCDDEYRLSDRERAEILTRYAALKRHVRSGWNDPDGPRNGPVGLAALLAREHEIRRGDRIPSKRAALGELLGETETFIHESSELSEEEAIMLRLLFCRLVVEAGELDRFEECKGLLDGAIEDAEDLSLLRLQMAGLDQRAFLHVHPGWSNDWERATDDAGRAGNLALQLIAENSPQAESGADPSTESVESIMVRALLRSLFPVLDRIVTLLAKGAASLEPNAALDRQGWTAEREQRWKRFGQAIHDYAEQSQRLALEEARRAYDTGETRAHGFALVSGAGQGEGDEDPIGAVQRMLRRGDVLLQYFVAGQYVIVFVLGRRFFDWSLSTMNRARSGLGSERIPIDAHDGLDALITHCKPWIEGGPAGTKRAARDKNSADSELLRDTLLPPSVAARLTRTRPRHLRIVPHDVLYRVPFGRLLINGVPLAEQMTTSLHPTAALAAESAGYRGRGERRRWLRKPFILGHVIGPRMERAAHEHGTMARALGRRPLARPMRLDTRGVTCEQFEKDMAVGVGLAGGSAKNLPAVESHTQLDGRDSYDAEVFRQTLSEMDLLHFTCHGSQVRPSGKARMTLGEEKRGASSYLYLGEVPGLNLHRCRLVLSQSCWTGWQEHRRENPVQGFPQAFCDAGAGAVIAPLITVPKALTSVFASVFYRVLGHLPVERALHSTLAMTSGFMSRLWSRISLWRWLRRMRRQQRKIGAAGSEV
ncbi:MAG: CHAT domain-containing protein [Proteobacteria bacterium]|nr:CHAT domain-containing protein [Pseudomonadota bacterium]